MPPKIKETINIQDAMNNLESIMNIDMSAPGPIGIVQKNKIVTSRDEFEGEVEWLESEGSEILLEVLDSSYKSVHDYLIFLAQSAEVDCKSRNGIQLIKSIVTLASSAAHKMEQFLEFRLGRPSAKISEREEFLELKNYYARHFSKPSKQGREEDLAEENWDKEDELFNIQVNAEKPSKESRKVTERPEYQAMHDFYMKQFSKDIAEDQPRNAKQDALQDMNEVRLDKDYELFYIRHEDGMPFYDLEILRNMRLACDFESDEAGFNEDPLLQIRTIQDRDASAAAGQILGECDHQIADFYKGFKKLINNDLAATLSHLCLSLFLSKNPRNLLQNGTGKTSLQYFEDAIHFLRHAYRTAEYQKLIAYPPESSDKTAYVLLHLVHSIAKSFFTRSSGVKSEAIGLIHRTTRKGKELESDSSRNDKAPSLWSQFLHEDEAYRTLLSKFPSGPLLKTLDLMRESLEEAPPFDPVAQGNFPVHLFEMGEGSTRVDFLHMPAPVRQYVINKVEILDEFRGMLRSYISSEPAAKHLLINLQDKTSWKESARCNSIEGLQKNAEFNKVLFVATIPKHTEFARQTGKYEAYDDAILFMNALIKQASLSEQNGMSFPSGFKATDYLTFAEAVVPFIHQKFFDKKKKLDHLQREEFIEIFDLFYSLKLIEQYSPTSVSFTSKDSIDAGSVDSAAFYAFIKLLSADFGNKEAQDSFRWMLYSPALFVRERAVNQICFSKKIAALQRIDSSLQGNSKAIMKEMTTFYKPQFMKNLKVKG